MLCVVVAACGGGVASVAPATPASVEPNPPSASASTAPVETASPSAAAAVPQPGEPWIAFQWQGNDGGDAIFLVRPDGSGLHELSPDRSGGEIHPDWSPDGRQLAFVSRSADTDVSSLWVVDADGTNAEQVYECTAPCNSLDYPDWPAADPNGIYWKQDSNAPSDGPPKTFELMRLDLATGTAASVITREDESTLEQPRLSPDGKWLAFARSKNVFDDAEGAAVFVMPAGGGDERQLSDWSLRGVHPDWLDEDTLVFNSDDLALYEAGLGRLSNLYTVDLDGGDPTALTTFTDTGTGLTQPRVMPDGRILAVEIDRLGSQRQLAVIDADGGGPALLPADATPGTHPQARPTAAP